MARKHGIITGLLFRWRVQYGVAQTKRATIAPVALTDGAPIARLLKDFLQPPDGMMAVDLADGRRVFAPIGNDPAAVRLQAASSGSRHDNRSRPREPSGCCEAAIGTHSHRKRLPDHLPREDIRLDIHHAVCACCGGALHMIGEGQSELLDWIPAQLRVIRITQPKYARRACEKVVQAPAPERLIAGGPATPALIAQSLSANIAITHRCIGSRRSSPGTVFMWCVPLSPAGLRRLLVA